MVVFAIGNSAKLEQSLVDQAALSSEMDSGVASEKFSSSQKVEIATDNWPYLYLAKREVPRLYFCLAFLYLLLFVFSTKCHGVSFRFSAWQRSHWHFFFLGAAFLLLEVQNVSKVSLVFGSTWATNSIVISSILVMILLANLFVYRFDKLNMKFCYLLLIASLLGLYFIDLAQFASLGATYKVLVVGGITSLPIFFSGIVFINSFAKVANRDLAVGANLLGALVGGYLQCLTFVIGVKALLLIVSFFYLLSYIFIRVSKVDVS